jgi:tetratricopeptide (TPR) repeat protein
MLSPFEPLPSIGSYVPDDADRLTHSLAVAVLGSDQRRAEDCIEGIAAIDAARRGRDEPPTGVLPYALDARNATLDDALAYRGGADALLRRKDLDPTLRARVEEEVADDPLRLAEERIHDARVRRFGRAFNAFSTALGRSAINGVMLPLRLLQSIVGVAIAEHQDDELTPPERQALAHWKRFIEEEPDTPEASALLDRIEAAQVRWFHTQRDRTVRSARKALEGGDAALAVALAERALRYAPEDGEANELLREAEERRAAWLANRARSVQAADTGSTAQRELAVALMLPGGPVAETATTLLQEDPEGPLADEAAFALATASGEAGGETPMWEQLEKVADLGDEHSNMARHARAAVFNAEQNPYRAFRAARRAQTWTVLRWLFFGPLAEGARERDLPRTLEWAIEIPTLVSVVSGFPNRLIRVPFMRPTSRAPSVLARRYLERYPYGEHAASVRDWLEGFEESRGNYFGALKLLEEQPEADEHHLAKLRNEAAEQALDAAGREKRRDVRLSLLERIAREFRGTEAGQKAGERAREEVETGTPQKIQVTRGFLLENPELAGPEGFALRPELLDNDLANGELHPEGITFLGGRTLQFAFVAESGNEDDPPRRTHTKVSAERLARVVALLEEISLRIVQVDRDARVEHDADRDLFFERAKLGVTETPDRRASAQSTYAFRGMREKYGLVRSRDSILPVEIVLQGSFDDFSLGAFPRIRMPKPTPDVMLYR